MRSANKKVAEQDIGIHYFTSNKHIKQNFDKFDVEIIAYFRDWASAFVFENETIKEEWENPKLLNKHYQNSISSFSMKGAKRDDVCENNKKTKTKPKELREYKCMICEKIFLRLEHSHKPKKQEFVCGHSCNGKRNGIKSKGKPNAKISEYKKGKPAWNKGISNPIASENGKKGAKNQSETVTGRKRKYLPNGKWCWEYPIK